MTEREALKLALTALEDRSSLMKWQEARDAVKEALAQPEQEPVACVQDLDEVKRKHLVYEKGMDWKDPLYTTPPQRKPLTREVIERDFHGRVDFVRQVEAAHGIKEDA